MPRSRLGLPNEERILPSALEALQKRSQARTLSSNSSSYSTSRFWGGNASHRTRARKGSLRSNRTRVPLGRCIATELEPKLRRYVATERPFRSVAT
ncbi:hypothetical protein F2Q70_00029770 [Brassica cretica]|uniref:Uncharacterized protein n=1 Tax=Brassica cretica TaxID=69181 RepID=A0A8S9FB90_BRACR|nr:hypothetical protein F2Q70_00029770 [Brassica cretica]